ncbi:uncharacterized protein N7459_003155 [Penicillium hispanicum]|uniref:uncharacterized protein n=1 Tax=Penicillium hispanicum TaxID=1080232 RepID=UPI00254114BB|nr:uncharacterized protein N7459_003155 [Penicillium hispanicum]KAJ5587390.1 hypothetical protein N7459_003155 [Penicillium hispanicum]
MTHAPEFPAISSPTCQDETSTAQDESAPTIEPAQSISKVYTQLSQQCLDLLTEIDELHALLKQTLRNPQLVEVRQFRSNVHSELRMLQKLEQQILSSAGSGQADAEAQDDSELEKRLMHALRSSNLPFYQAVWDIAKGSCEGLVALGKRFYWDDEVAIPESKSKSTGNADSKKQSNKDKRKSVFVDIVADEGEEWVKVSTLSETRLLFEMANKGWERASEQEFSDDGSEGPPRTVLRNFEGEDDREDDDDDELELIKLAKDLRKAADAARVRYKHPRLRVVLFKIQEGNSPEIDDIVNEMRSYGVEVVYQNSLPVATGKSGLVHLLPQPFKKFTPTLNVDCTLLLAMVSDLSHVKDIAPSPSFHRAIVRQIEVEKEKPLLPTELWPAMGENELVCTNEAATRMREIVETIGTETEKRRMMIMMGNSPYDHLDRASLVERFQQLSDYHVPTNWKVPIRTVDAQPIIDAGKTQGKLPAVAHEVSQNLSDINHSVFMYGWTTGMTTISSNRTIDKQIEMTIEKNRRGGDDIQGPSVWICDTARSLVGKDKDRKA